MPSASHTHPSHLRTWEKWTLLILCGGLFFLAAHGKGRKEREAYERFVELAPQVQAALERFAADHEGRYPPDAMHTARPLGLDDKYIRWDQGWKIDYEVHPNGEGGKSVCLEFGGPFVQRYYFGLCRKPEYRRLYGRGQAIPGHFNRIWVVQESAQIMPDPCNPAPPPPPPPPDQAPAPAPPKP